MPTPFTHLETAGRLLNDPEIPSALRDALKADVSAFLLGNIAADARTGADMKREDTHFYNYDTDITDHPWRVMVNRNPSLLTPHSPAQRVFVAGYVAHLTMDETWSLEMLGPHFASSEWGPRQLKFLMLHAILIYMDERDERKLGGWEYPTLAAAQPDEWLPFMSDVVLRDWRDFIAAQIAPGGSSQTLEVFGSRINKTPAELRAVLDSPERMQTDLWDHIPQATLAEVEADMYTHARAEMQTYWAETGG
jgi:hypothetical protein